MRRRRVQEDSRSLIVVNRDVQLRTEMDSVILVLKKGVTAIIFPSGDGISSWMAELKCLLHDLHYYNSTDRSLAVINPESSPTCEGPYVKLKLTFHFSDHHHSSYTRSIEGPKTGGCLIFLGWAFYAPDFLF